MGETTLPGDDTGWNYGNTQCENNLGKNNTAEGGELSRPSKASLPKKLEALILKRVTHLGKMPC